MPHILAITNAIIPIIRTLFLGTIPVINLYLVPGDLGSSTPFIQSLYSDIALTARLNNTNDVQVKINAFIFKILLV